MLFNSFTFLVFFIITFFIYYLPPLQGWQLPILVLASLIFYSWSAPALLILLVISILINSATSFQVARSLKKDKQIFWAVVGIAINISILSLFKYGALLTHIAIDNTKFANPESGIIYLLLHLPLPIGISFYTFEGISLLVDVLAQKNSPTPSDSYVSPNFFQHLLNTSFFIAFFPHLIAGPILKAKHFYPQISPKYIRDIPWNIVFRSLVVGYFLKMVIADNLKDYTFWISYPYYYGFGTITNLVFLFGYSIQIFADFAGYSLIAIGLAASLGYTLPDNFNFPYISRSLSEFWRRWHISLSTWLRDYLYFPLGGNRKGKIRTYLNLMVVMTLGGLWHGAAWSYAVWGIYHGLGLAAERFFSSLQKFPADTTQKETSIWQQLILDIIKVIFVFSFGSLGWLLFKLPRLEEAVYFLGALVKNIGLKPTWSYILPVLIFSLPVVVYHIPHFPTWQKIMKKDNLGKFANNAGRIYQDIAIGIMLALILLNSGSSKEFIYFQF
ncbi:MAG TPA: MBOAT family O-acyltransferase [Kamptonema sp.]|nr:MBOAT family O-acyltransferase [Kamptonema sp.]